MAPFLLLTRPYRYLNHQIHNIIFHTLQPEHNLAQDNKSLRSIQKQQMEMTRLLQCKAPGYMNGLESQL